jgi:catechol 2,3-dioxygenase-like lactoylglutathione lyase family enzyme
VIPVSDVDRAKEFYAKLGWRLDRDFRFANGLRAVQFTPPGSGCAVHFGTNQGATRIDGFATSAAPGSAKGYLIVSDIVAARNALIASGIEVGEFFHLGEGGVSAGLDPSVAPTVPGPRSMILTVTPGFCRRSQHGFLGSLTLVRLRSARQITWPPRCDVRLQPTMSMRSASGSTTRTGRNGTPPTWWRRRAGRSCRGSRPGPTGVHAWLGVLVRPAPVVGISSTGRDPPIPAESRGGKVDAF